MTHTHTVTWAGEAHTRTSQSRIYTHAVAVTRPARAAHGYEYPETSFILSWSSSEKLAQAAASTARAQRQFDGTEKYSYFNRRQRVKGNGPAVYSRVEVLEATVVSKDLDPKRLVATLTKRAVKEGERALYWAQLEGGRVTDEQVADFAGSAARWAVSNANKALAAKAGVTCTL